MTHSPRPGPPGIDAAAFAHPNPHGGPPTRPPRAARKKSSVVVIINTDLLTKLRAHCAATNQSPTEAILTAHVEFGEAVQGALEPTDADRRRLGLGLPQAAASGRLGPGKPLSLWLAATSVAELTAAAARVGVTRRRYVTALVEALLAGASPPAEPSPASPPRPDDVTPGGSPRRHHETSLLVAHE